MPASDSDRILAPGVPLTLADGRVVMVRYSLRSLKMFEDAFGSLDVVSFQLNGLIPDGPKERARNRKPVSTIVPILAVGLLGEGLTEDDLYDGGLLDYHKLTSEYFDAIAAALEQAFPSAGSAGKADEAPDEAAASTGPASTTPPPSDSVAAMSSSGA